MKLQSLTRTYGRQVLKLKRNSPHIFFVGGIVGVVGSTVLACRATLKLDKQLDEIKHDIESVKELHSNPSEDSIYPQQQYSRDLAYVYGKSARRLVVLYGPSIIVGGVSIAALTGSHIQLTRRNAALTATLAATLKSFEEYRLRVQEEIGEDRENEIHRATREEKVGKEVKKSFDPYGRSPYARIFDEANPEWRKDAERNRMFIQCQQQHANNLLRARGHVFLNDVYDSLGFDRSSAGAVVGWVYNGDGDGFVDFGLYEPDSQRFMDGLERSVFLDFNVDGVIYTLIDNL